MNAYKILKEYLTKWKLENYLRLLALFIIIGSVFVLHLIQIRFTENNTLFYLFSTIAQTFGSILGIYIAILIFTVSSVDNKRDSLKTSLFNAIQDKVGNSFISTFQLEEYIEKNKFQQKFSDPSERLKFIILYATFKGLRKYKEYLISNAKFPIIINVFTIMFCLTTITLSNRIAKDFMGIALVLISLELSIWCLIEMTFYAIKLPDISTAIELDDIA